MATGGAAYGDLLITSLIVLAAVCVGGFLLVRFAGRWLATGRARGAHMMDVLARVPLEPRRSLYVVEVAGKTLLVGTSEMGLNVLTELDANEVKARHVPQQSFADLVRNAIGKRRKLPQDAAGNGADPRGFDERGAVGADAIARDAATPIGVVGRANADKVRDAANPRGYAGREGAAMDAEPRGARDSARSPTDDGGT